MGTRADFYVGKTESDMQWLGSIACDGYPGGFETGLEKAVFDAQDESEYVKAVRALLESRDDGSIPERDGWPWPWDTSHTSDYAYTFAEGKVQGSSGSTWWPVSEEQPDEPYWKDSKNPVYFPNMKRFAKVTWGPRSGLLILKG